MSNMGMIIKEFGKVKISERKKRDIVRVRKNGETSLRKVSPSLPYTKPLSESELETVKNKLNLN